jgi:hypothetical protein
MRTRLGFLVLLALVPALMFFTNNTDSVSKTGSDVILIGGTATSNGANTIKINVVAAENIMKTVENSTVRIGKKSFEIDAVSGHVTHMDLTLKDTVAYQIYLSFYEKTDDGQYVEIPGSEMNADRDDFTLGVKKGLPVNASAATIKATVNAVMTGMIAGTPTQKWGAYNAVMTGYGAPLLPLAQQ